MRVWPFIFAAFWNATVVGAEAVDGSPTTIERCPLLEQAVTLRLSVGVRGAWACNVVTKNIKVAACSQYGSIKSANIRCSPIAVNADGSVLYNLSSCTSDPTIAVNVVGAKAFVASSAYPASTMVGVSQGCDDAAIAGMDFFSDN